MPVTIRFLSHNPLPAASTLAEQLVRQRTSLGLSQKECAGRIGVDPGTMVRWERGEREPAEAFVARVKEFLQDGGHRAYDVWGSGDPRIWRAPGPFNQDFL